MPLSDYELQREARMKENEATLAAMGCGKEAIEQEKENLHKSVKPKIAKPRVSLFPDATHEDESAGSVTRHSCVAGSQAQEAQGGIGSQPILQTRSV